MEHNSSLSKENQLLNYKVLETSGYTGYIKKEAPVKILQFGEGNFLRAFVDYWFDVANEKAGFDGKAILVQPIRQGLSELINAQEGLYTLYLRGMENGERVNRKRVISLCKCCYDPYTQWNEVLKAAEGVDLKYIVSNTTEAGIAYDPAVSFEDAPPASFPGKLTKLLYHRFQSGLPGLVILSCELIDNNGKELLFCVKQHIRDWQLGDEFEGWIENENLFCSTLVDRIVPGRIRDAKELEQLEAENGYTDQLLDVGEVFGVWYIEGPGSLAQELPFQKAGLNVHVVPDISPYKKRKVRILNGAHTGFVPGAFLSGQTIVRDCMYDEVFSAFLNRMLDTEIIPSLPLERADCEEFAHAVSDRFKNPYVDHQLLDITLNSTSKWAARNLPSMLDYIQKQESLPPCLAMSLAAYIVFYSSNIKKKLEDRLICVRENGEEYPVRDDLAVLDFYYDRKDVPDNKLVKDVLSNHAFWKQDLTKINGLYDMVLEDLKNIRANGAREAFRTVL